ncbi:phosphoglycerate mutase [Gaetbulibacter sp. 4G1]|nr:phosphoglycerate mutase family protein [Gaetbulibacter sp. 4G1]PIA77692.1 phosphoglycerate mutase [Gaetbulibacter sp. 4G1]
MKQLFIIGFLLIFTFPSFSQTEESTKTTTYYFIRHAEKDRSDKTNKNPHLTEAGKKRAERWNNILKHVKFDAVYSTDYNRTRETAKPTATKNELELILYHPHKLDKEAFLSDTKNKTVLVVGHSNSTPTFVNSILGYKKYKHIDDNNNGNLYIVTIIDEKIIDQVLEIN